MTVLQPLRSRSCSRFSKQFAERQLAESRAMRRLAQLSVYLWERLGEVAAQRRTSEFLGPEFSRFLLGNVWSKRIDIWTMHYGSNLSPPGLPRGSVGRVWRRFLKNLGEEIRRLR